MPFGEELVHYAVGPGTCAVPGLPGGLDALWRRYGRLPWPRLVEPALRLARSGVTMPPAHAACLAMLAPVFTMSADGERIYAPAGHPLAAGRRARPAGPRRPHSSSSPPRARAASTAARSPTPCSAVEGIGVARADLERYEARWTPPVELPYAGTRFLTRAGLSGVPESLARLQPLRGLGGQERVRVLLAALEGPAVDGHTTNLVDGGLRRKRVRPHVEPRTRDRRLPRRPRPAPEQHARRGRPRSARRSCRASEWRA